MNKGINTIKGVGNKFGLATLFLWTIFFSSCENDDNFTDTQNTISGSIELYDEYGNIISKPVNGIAVIKVLDNENKTFQVSSEGRFGPIEKDFDSLLFSKEGFGELNIPAYVLDETSKVLIRLSEKSSMEVGNLNVTEGSCAGLPCFRLTYEVKNYFTTKTNKRYFEVDLENNGEILDTFRYFGFLESNDSQYIIEPINSKDARISFKSRLFSQFDGLNSMTPLTFKVYGVANDVHHLDFHPMGSNDTRNPVFGKYDLELE